MLLRRKNIENSIIRVLKKHNASSKTKNDVFSDKKLRSNS